MRDVALTDVCDFQGGTQPPKSEWSSTEQPGYIRMLQIRDFTQSNEKYIEYVRNKPSLKTCTEKDILIGRYGASIGKILTGLSGAYNVAIVKTIPNTRVLDRDFLLHLLKSCSFQNFILNIGSRAAQAGFNKKELAKFRFQLPPLVEQKQIAAILDVADSLRQKDQQLVEHYTALSQSLFLEMFGDPVTNPKKWNIKYFSDIFTTKTGKLDSNAASGTGVYPFFTCAKQPLKIDSYTYDEEALLLAGNNAAGIFDVKYYNGKFDAYQRTYILTIKGNELTYSFIKVALEKKLADLQRLSIGSSTQYLTMQILKRLEFTVPPIQLQNQFAERIAIIEQQKQQAQINLKKSEALFNSLLQRAFTGELTADKAA